MTSRPLGGDKRRRKAATTGDIELWRAAMHGVHRLRRDPPPPPPPAPSLPEAPPASEAPPAPLPRRAVSSGTQPAITGQRAPGLDRASAERLKRGQYPIEARLDLHGMTQDEAHRALAAFIGDAARHGMRCVIVITGKGLRRLAAGGSVERGILQSAVPRWLNEAPSRGRILAFTTAQPRDGGSGALYVLLRRRR